jgi:hypothetical protein
MTEQKASRSPTSSSIRGRRANSEKRILQKEFFKKELSKKNSSKRILKKVRRQKDALIAIGQPKASARQKSDPPNQRPSSQRRK